MEDFILDSSPDKTVYPTAVVPVLSCLISNLLISNDNLYPDYKMTCFHSYENSSMTVSEYLERIASYSLCSGESLILGLIYLDRIVNYNPDFIINSKSIHRLYLCSVLTAVRFHDDHSFPNSFFAKIGGISVLELNYLHLQFLILLRYDVFLNFSEIFGHYYSQLCVHVTRCLKCKQSIEIPFLKLLDNATYEFPVKDTGCLSCPVQPIRNNRRKNHLPPSGQFSPSSSSASTGYYMFH